MDAGVPRVRPRVATARARRIIANLNATIGRLDGDGAADAAESLRRHARLYWKEWLTQSQRSQVPDAVPPTREEQHASVQPGTQKRIVSEVLAGLQPLRRAGDELKKRVDAIVQRADMLAPTVWVADAQPPNACVVGFSERDAHMVVTTGLLRSLDERETDAVLGHELGHIRLGHSALNTALAAKAMGIAVGANVVAGIAELAVLTDADPGNDWFGLLLGIGIRVIGAASAASSLSHGLRRAEYAADASGASLTDGWSGLSAALRKIERMQTNGRWGGRAAQHIAHAFVIRPNVRWSLGEVSTHPATAWRVEALRILDELSWQREFVLKL